MMLLLDGKDGGNDHGNDDDNDNDWRVDASGKASNVL